MTLPDAHLDLGCGKFPRNPYSRSRLCGVDIRGLKPAEGFELRPANLALEPIPYADNVFGSVSAFDFIEHIPRVLNGPEPNTTVFPFVRLMNEVWRVLKTGAEAEIITPDWSHASAYGDPTHQWPPMSHWYLVYLNKQWRDKNTPHVPYNCDFVTRYSYSLDESLRDQPNETKRFAVGHYTNAARDLQAVLTKRG